MTLVNYRRTLTAALLLLVAISVPSVAWYVVGARDTDDQAADLLRESRASSDQLAARLAERIGARLEFLLASEGRRPHYEYRNRYPDLSDECSCAPIIDSPLSRGPTDELVWTHFEIDRTRAVTIPTAPVTDAAESALSRRENVLERAKLSRLESSRQALIDVAWPSRAVKRSLDTEARAEGVLVRYGEQEAFVEPFRWVSFPITGKPHLSAVRVVREPDGTRIQGFIVSSEGVAQLLGNEDSAPAFVPTSNATGDETLATVSSAPVGATTWEVRVDSRGAVQSATLESTTARREFQRRFWVGTGGALLAAVFVVGLVGQTERLALERARFAASAAHELRTPLAGLQLYGDMLAENLGREDAKQDYARRISSEAERLGRVVTNVLGYSRLERSGSRVRPELGDLADAVTESVEKLRRPLELAGARLRLEIEPDVPAVAFDRDAVSQILQNLIDNAERYGRDASNREILVALNRSDEGVVLSVTDHGPGVPDDEARRIFRPFERGGHPDLPSGLGLGLSLVDALAKAHRGSVRVQPNPSGGSIFRVTFPQPSV